MKTYKNEWYKVWHYWTASINDQTYATFEFAYGDKDVKETEEKYIKEGTYIKTTEHSTKLNGEKY